MGQTRFKIEKRIPQPSQRVHGNSKYPFGEMAVGDSFALEPAMKRRIARTAYVYGARKKKKFSVRGNRIWRTA
jgi:hypothetical protein